MKRLAVTISVVGAWLAGGMLFGTPAQAKPWDRGERGFGPGGPIKAEMAAVLDLSDDQKKQFENVINDYRPALHERMRTVREAEDQLREAIDSNGGDEQKIRAAARNLAAAEEELYVLRGKMIAGMRGFLSAGQREKAKALRGMRGEFGLHRRF